MKRLLLIMLATAVQTACSGDIVVNPDVITTLAWTWLNIDLSEKARDRLIFEDPFSENSSSRLNQSICIWCDKVFCFSHGNECKVLDLQTKEWLSSFELPETSHNNNSQFLNSFYDQTDKYPLMLLSRGDYPPNQNDVYIGRIQEKDNHFSFSIIKTIHNSIQEAQNNGSWVVDEDHGKLFLYTMTKGDYRVLDDNKFCIFSFNLPDIKNEETIILGYDDVVDRWEYKYFALQGGTYHNNRLFFNVESLTSLGQKQLASSKNVLAINVENGLIEATLPLYASVETEGICVYKNNLYVSFRDANLPKEPTDIVFYLKEYSIAPSFL